uniref:Uncharacterized protein n=1 Tax=Anguilla anguilla TaxID=7936 RepID=A0A0E9RVB2_ANGAN
MPGRKQREAFRPPRGARIWAGG